LQKTNKRTGLIAFSLIFIALISSSQTVQLFQSAGNTILAPGDTFKLTVKNNAALPAKFYPLTVFDEPGNLVFLNNQHFIQHLQSQSDQVTAIRELARIYKSPYFNNTTLEYSSTFDPETKRKQFAFIPSVLSVRYRQCKEYWYQASYELTEAGIINKDSLRSVSCTGHFLGEAIVGGDTTLIDFDPGEPRFLDTLPDGSFISAADMQEHPELIDNQSSYCYATPTGCNLLMHGEIIDENIAYKEFFTNSPVNYMAVEPEQTVSIEGTWTLCPGCSFTMEYRIPKYFLDMNIAANVDAMKVVTTLIAADSVEEAKTLLGQLIGSSSTTETLRAYLEDDIFFYTGLPTFENFFNTYSSSFSAHVTSTGELSIPARAGGYTIGVDVALPFLINEVRASSAITVGDTVLSNGTGKFDLWYFKNSKEDTSHLEPPQLPARDIQYLQSGSIPSNTSVTMQLYYNPLVYRFPMGISAEIFSGVADSLSVDITQTSNPTTAIHEPLNSGAQDCGTSASYFTIQMQEVVPPLIPGIYIRKCGSVFRKIMVR